MAKSTSSDAIVLLLMLMLVLGPSIAHPLPPHHHNGFDGGKYQAHLHPHAWVLYERVSAFKPQSTPRTPGSRPPPCHNDCPGCVGTCMPRPSYFQGGHRTGQHAVWTCICLHS